MIKVIQEAPEGSELYESAISQLEDASEIPFYIAHIWEWFWQINKGRTYHMSGPNPITWQDIEAWSNLLSTQIQPIEVEILKEIDSVYLEYMAEKQKKKG